MNPTPTSQDNTDELRHEIHMQMLAKSENAKDLGDLTVVPLGFAVDVALSLAAQARTEAAREAGIAEMNRLANAPIKQLRHLQDYIDTRIKYLSTPSKSGGKDV